MGRPFIIYDDDDDVPDSPSTSNYQNNDGWFESANKALQEHGYDISNQNILAILSYLLSLRKPAFLPNCAPAPQGGLSLTDSKIGGLPYLLPTESWPSCDGTGLCHLWQQRVSELPTAVQRALGYNTGLMQVFLSESLEEGGEGKWYLVRVLSDDQLVQRLPSDISVGPDVEVLDEQAVTGFRMRQDWPHAEDLLAALPEGLDAALAEEVVGILQDYDLLGTVSGDKLLGWPNWCQGPDWCRADSGERYLQLVQIEGSVVPFPVGDSGTLLLQRHPADRNMWDVSWACC